MRNLAIASTGIAVVTGIVAANLWRELHAERELTSSLRSELSEAAARPAGNQYIAPQQVGIAAAPEVGTQTPAVADSQTRTEPTTEDVARASINASTLRQQELLKDPEYRAAQLAQIRMMLPQNNPGLIDELQLTPDEAAELFELLASHQLEMNEIAAPILAAGSADPAVMQERMRAQTALRERQQAELASHLGSRYPQWETYQQERPSHMQIAQLSRSLESAGQSLSDAQVRPLVAAMAREQRRAQQEWSTFVQSLGTATDPQARAAQQQRMQEEQLRYRANDVERVLEAARPHLTAAQLDAFRTMLESQIVLTRAATQGARTGTVVPGTSSAPSN